MMQLVALCGAWLVSSLSFRLGVSPFIGASWFKARFQFCFQIFFPGGTATAQLSCVYACLVTWTNRRDNLENGVDYYAWKY